MKVTPKVSVIVSTIVALTILWQWRLVAERQEALRDAQIQRLEQTADSLTRVSDSLAKAFHRDTVRLTKWVTRWDTVKAGTDTFTVTVPVEVVRTVIVTADSTIRACTLAVADCGKARAAAELKATNLQAALTTALKPEPFIKRLSNRMIWLGGGVVLGQLVPRR